MPDVQCLECTSSDVLRVCVYVCVLSDLPHGGGVSGCYAGEGTDV